MSKKPIETEEFNPAADLIEKVFSAWNSHKNSLSVITLIVVIGFVVYLFYGHIQNQKISKASEAYGALSLTSQSDKALAKKALENIVTENSGTDYATYSSYLLAQQLLTDGNYDDAIVWFDKTLSGSNKNNFIVAESYEGKGIAFEAKGEISSAIEMYKKVISLKEGQHRKASVEYKLALLLKNEGKFDEALSYCYSIKQDSLVGEVVKTSVENLEVSIEMGR